MKTRHQFKAELKDGKTIIVKDHLGNIVKPSFGATTDMRTCYAHLSGVGFIGGWTCWKKTSKAPVWSSLVGSINSGVCCSDMNELVCNDGRRRNYR